VTGTTCKNLNACASPGFIGDGIAAIASDSAAGTGITSDAGIIGRVNSDTLVVCGL